MQKLPGAQKRFTAGADPAMHSAAFAVTAALYFARLSRCELPEARSVATDFLGAPAFSPTFQASRFWKDYGLTGSYSGLAGLLHTESDSFFENSKAIRLYVIRKRHLPI